MTQSQWWQFWCRCCLVVFFVAMGFHFAWVKGSSVSDRSLASEPVQPWYEASFKL